MKSNHHFSQAIDDSRKEIEEIDGIILELLQRRFTIIDGLAELKKHSGRPVEDREREAELVNKAGKGRLDHSEEVLEIYRLMIEFSKKIQWEKLFPLRLFLIGFMGSGKTTLGELLSEKLHYGYLDTDKEIERITGMTIETLFQNKGETFFREKEKELVRKLYDRRSSDNESLVIACGGGMILDSENREMMKKLGTIVFLDVPPEIIYERIKNTRHRPLLSTGQSLENRIYSILEERFEIYRKAADLVVPIRHETVQESLALVYQKIEGYALGRSNQ